MTLSIEEPIQNIPQLATCTVTQQIIPHSVRAKKENFNKQQYACIVITNLTYAAADALHRIFSFKFTISGFNKQGSSLVDAVDGNPKDPFHLLLCF